MTSATSPPTLVFDIDQTLCDFRTAMSIALETTCVAAAQLRPSLAGVLTVEVLRRSRTSVAALPEARRWTMEEIRLRSISEALQAHGSQDRDLPRQLTDVYLEARFGAAEVYPDVVSTLHELQGHYRLAAYSNGNSYLERLELGHFFEEVFFGYQHGVSKPEAAFYALVQRELRCPAAQLVSIGDCLANDVHGPKRAGWAAIHVTRSPGADAPAGTAGAGGEPAPDATVTSLEELPEVLGSWPFR